MEFTDKYKTIRNKYAVRSNKVLIKFFQTEFKDQSSNLILPEGTRAKQIEHEDLPKYLDEQELQGLVIGIGDKVQIEEPVIQIGKIVYLRSLPTQMELVIIEHEVFYVVDLSIILCVKL